MRWLLAISCVLLTGCQSGGGLGLFERKPETTPGDLRVEQYQDGESKKTVITGKNDANAKDGIAAELGKDGEVSVISGGSRKLEKWGEDDNSMIKNWGWVFLAIGIIGYVMRVNGLIIIPGGFCATAIGLGLFNITIASTVLALLTGLVWNLLCVGILLNYLIPGLWANIKQAAAGK